MESDPGASLGVGRVLKTGSGIISRNWRALLAYGLIPLVTGLLVIGRAFKGDGLLPIDLGDEPAETFVPVPMAQARLAAGDILKINLFNNFGTPILGDPVVYPFALHAWTYALLRPVLAMLVNKFVLSALSLAILTLFFSRYFGTLVSSFCAFLTFSSPSFFYFMHNHPHQGVLFYYGLLLLSLRWFFAGVGTASPPSAAEQEERTGDRPPFSLRQELSNLLACAAGRGVCLYASVLVFLFSVGINGALLGGAFAVAYALLLSKACNPQSAIRNPQSAPLVWALCLGVAALVAVHPHVLEFFRLAAASARKDFDYQRWQAAAPWDLIKGIFLWDAEHEKLATSGALCYSVPVAGLLAAGIALCLRRKSAARNPTSETRSSQSTAVDGLRTTEPVSRFTFHASRIPHPASGRPNRPPSAARAAELRRLLILVGVLPLLAVLLGRLFPGFVARIPLLKGMNLTRILWFSDLFLMLAAGVAVESTLRVLTKRDGSFNPLLALVLVFLAVAILLRYGVMRAQANWFLASERMTGFQPVEFLNRMKAGARMAALSDPLPWSYESKAGSHGILGSSGRSIIADRPLRDHLRAEGLIEMGFSGMTWFFRPGPPEALGRFGIRYCLTEHFNAQMEQWGWKLAATASDPIGTLPLALYENPLEPAPVFIAGAKPQFLPGSRIEGNEVEAELPPRTEPYEVVATFLNRPGWKASLDGRPVPIRTSRDRFIEVNVKASERPHKLLLRYEPYSNAYLIGCVIVSAGAAGLLCWMFQRQMGRGHDR